MQDVSSFQKPVFITANNWTNRILAGFSLMPTVPSGYSFLSFIFRLIPSYSFTYARQSPAKTKKENTGITSVLFFALVGDDRIELPTSCL
jgi:hypothetical protein